MTPMRVLLSTIGSRGDVQPPDMLRRLPEATIATQFTTVMEAARGCDVIVAAPALQIAAHSAPDDGTTDTRALWARDAGEVDHQALFLRAAAVVHHGGAGTTTVAARAGAPQVLVPQAYDQHDWARRIQALGVGVAHAPGTPTGPSLAEAVGRALDDLVARRAARPAGSVADDGAAAAAARLMLVPARTGSHG